MTFKPETQRPARRLRLRARRFARQVGQFKRSDNGAITVDWVVLCAAVLALVTLMTSTTHEGVMGAAGLLTAYMEGML